MKFYFFWGFMLACCWICNGQGFDEKVLIEMYQQHISQAKLAVSVKEYRKAEALMSELVGQFTEKPHLITQKYITMLGDTYYKLSCYLSLQHKRKQAIKALTEAVEWGWDNYDQLKTDSSMNVIRNCRQYKKVFEIVQSKKDYLYILQRANAYVRSKGECDIHFTYMSAADKNLKRVRTYFRLDSVAGQGDEVSRIKNLMEWVHSNVRHSGSSPNPVSLNAIDIIEFCRKENRAVNGRMMALILNECYLAMGFKSRVVTCFPKVFKGDCHIVNLVFSDSLQKWICMDPSHNTYLTDEKGILLDIAEVRERLQRRLPLVLNNNANLNGEKFDKDEYLYSRLTKNFYWFSCVLKSEYDAETEYEGKVWGDYVGLLPEGYQLEGTQKVDRVTYDDECFWQIPEHID